MDRKKILEEDCPANENDDPNAHAPSQLGDCVIFLFRMEEFDSANDLRRASYTIVLAPEDERDTNAFLETYYVPKGWIPQIRQWIPGLPLAEQPNLPQFHLWRWNSTDQVHAAQLLKEALETLSEHSKLRQKPLASFRYIPRPLAP